jgi:hypothetical protein
MHDCKIDNFILLFKLIKQVRSRVSVPSSRLFLHGSTATISTQTGWAVNRNDIFEKTTRVFDKYVILSCARQDAFDMPGGLFYKKSARFPSSIMRRGGASQAL